MGKDCIDFLIPEGTGCYTNDGDICKITSNIVVKIEASLAGKILNGDHQTVLFKGEIGNLNLDTSEFLVEN